MCGALTNTLSSEKHTFSKKVILKYSNKTTFVTYLINKLYNIIKIIVIHRFPAIVYLLTFNIKPKVDKILSSESSPNKRKLKGVPQGSIFGPTKAFDYFIHLIDYPPILKAM